LKREDVLCSEVKEWLRTSMVFFALELAWPGFRSWNRLSTVDNGQYFPTDEG
jgi:hypothetical protein